MCVLVSVCVLSTYRPCVYMCGRKQTFADLTIFSSPFGRQQTRSHRDACGDSLLLISSSSASHPSFHPPTTPFILFSHYQHRNPQPMGNYSVLRLMPLSKICFFPVTGHTQSAFREYKFFPLNGTRPILQMSSTFIFLLFNQVRPTEIRDVCFF